MRNPYKEKSLDDKELEEAAKRIIREAMKQQKLHYRILEPFKRFGFAFSRACWEFVEAWKCYYD